MLHIPLLRRGKPYQSLDVVRTPHHRTREPFVEISQANVGLIRRDLLHLDDIREKLAGNSSAELLQICNTAAELFLHTELPVGEAVQTVQGGDEGLAL